MKSRKSTLHPFLIILAVAMVFALFAVSCGGGATSTAAPDTGAAEAAAAEAAAAEAARLKAEQETAERERVRRDRAIAEARSTLRELASFDYDESAITDQAQQVLRRKIPILRDSPTVQIRLEGHADERGSTEYNLALGSRRAESVRDFLSGFGISADRLTTTSFGEDRPLVSRSDENAWSRNRRVEFVITGGTIVP